MKAHRTVPGSNTTKDNRELAIERLEALRKDMRGEIKQRIKQRDQYSIQLTIALAVLVSIGATAATTRTDITPISETSIVSFGYRVLLAAPLVSVYFTTLILYSYRIHNIITDYLRNEIEPELAKLCGTCVKKEWETYYQANQAPGIRKWFFIVWLWVVTIGSPLYVCSVENWQYRLNSPLVILSAIYLLVAFWITITFWKK